MKKFVFDFRHFIIMTLCISSFTMGSAFAQNPRLKADLNLQVARCTQCHTLEIADNSIEILPSEVANLIERMKGQPGSLIPENETTRLYQVVLFKIYANRRAELEQKLNELNPTQKKEEINALKAALAPYK